MWNVEPSENIKMFIWNQDLFYWHEALVILIILKNIDYKPKPCPVRYRSNIYRYTFFEKTKIKMEVLSNIDLLHVWEIIPDVLSIDVANDCLCVIIAHFVISNALNREYYYWRDIFEDCHDMELIFDWLWDNRIFILIK